MGYLRTVLEVARQTLRLQLQNRLFLLLVLALVGTGALGFIIGFDPPRHMGGRHLFCVLSWWLIATVLAPWTTMYFAVQAIHGDIEDRTFQYLFVRPVARTAVLLGKTLAVALLGAVATGAGTGLVFLGLSLHEDLWGDGIEYRLLVVMALAMGLLSVAYAVVGALFAARFRRPLIWSAGFIVGGQVFLANLPARAGIRHVTVADPVRRFLLDGIDPDSRLARMLWPAERDWSGELIGRPLLDLAVIVGVALLLALVSYTQKEYDSRERE